MSEILNCLKKIQSIISGFQNAVLHHKTRHQDAGSDEINVQALSGELADPQKPKAHTLASHSTKGHPELTGVTSGQHHAQSHTLASHSTKGHPELTGVTASQHHTPGITFNLGLATVGIKQAQALIPGPLTISKVKIYADTAPVGASLIVDVNKNGTTIFTTQANRPAIPSGGHADDSGAPNVTSLAEGDRLSVDVDQVGSTTPGDNDLLVTIIC